MRHLRLYPHYFFFFVRKIFSQPKIINMKLENIFPQFCSLECHLFSALSGFLLFQIDFDYVPDVIALLWLLPDELNCSSFPNTTLHHHFFLLGGRSVPKETMDVSSSFVFTTSVRKRQDSIPSKCIMVLCLFVFFFFYRYSTFDLQLLQQTVVLIIVVS